MEPEHERGMRSTPIVFPPPPPLPQRLVDLRPVLIIGTVAWFVAFCVLLITGTPHEWLWTTLAGWILGFIGYAISQWQRTAARRGSRGAQPGLEAPDGGLHPEKRPDGGLHPEKRAEGHHQV